MPVPAPGAAPPSHQPIICGASGTPSTASGSTWTGTIVVGIDGVDEKSLRHSRVTRHGQRRPGRHHGLGPGVAVGFAVGAGEAAGTVPTSRTSFPTRPNAPDCRSQARPPTADDAGGEAETSPPDVLGQGDRAATSAGALDTTATVSPRPRRATAPHGTVPALLPSPEGTEWRSRGAGADLVRLREQRVSSVSITDGVHDVPSTGCQIRGSPTDRDGAGAGQHNVGRHRARRNEQRCHWGW